MHVAILLGMLLAVLIAYFILALYAQPRSLERYARIAQMILVFLIGACVTVAFADSLPLPV